MKLEPYDPVAVINLARLLEETGLHQDAIRLYEERIRHAPLLEFYVNLGALYVSVGRPDLALDPLEAAIKIAPDCSTAIINYGMAYAALGRDEGAMDCYRRALAIDPGNIAAMKRLAALLERLGRGREAIRLIEGGPAECRTPEVLLRLGNLLLAAGRKQEAVDAFGQAVALRDDFAEAHFNLAIACLELHDADQARSCFARAAELRPERPLWRLRAELCAPVVWENREKIEAYCARVERFLVEWNRTHHAPREEYGTAAPASEQEPAAETAGRTAQGIVPATLDDILTAGVYPGIALSYHGRDQRRLKERFATMYEPYFRNQPAPHGGGYKHLKRIGILVVHRHEAIFLRCMAGILKRLDPRFELVMICQRNAIERLRKGVRRLDLQFVALDASLQKSIGIVREAACDLIYYWEVGSNSMNYFLPFARLAPVQCTGWASTLTNGVSAVDYFLSSSLIESANADEQYTETLWRSKTLFMCAPRLPAVTPADSAYFGLSNDRRLYVCAQNPLKLHPDFDSLMAGILEADPHGLVVLVADHSGNVARLLAERFARRIPHVAERIVFLPRQSFADYCRLLQLADVVLDTRHFGAGVTCYDIFSFDLPIVTWPGELLPGRFTQACYRKMGVEDLIVHSGDEYVRKAVQVATDREYRQYVTGRIAATSDVLFNDIEAVHEHERFFEDVLRPL
jgi:predicted O-linked N-acetylglucosamine transferase (SPINDLY family)